LKLYLSVTNSYPDALALSLYHGLTTSQTMIAGLVKYSIFISSGKNNHSISTDLSLEIFSNSTLKEVSFFVFEEGKNSENHAPFLTPSLLGHGNLAAYIVSSPKVTTSS